MLLKIGEMASRTGLTVRTLHYYDELGLLSPSVRSDAGYRLYNRADVARLHRILALRQLGLPLADIGTSLANEGLGLPVLIERQLQALDTQIAEATALRVRLIHLQTALQQGGQPELADWLTTLELMTMYDKYFTADEQAEFSKRNLDPAVLKAQQTWPALIEEVRQLMAAGTDVSDVKVQSAAARWSDLVQQFTGNDPGILVKSAQMMLNEPGMHAQTGIEPAMMAYMSYALASKRLTVYERYLDQDEMARMRTSYGKNGPVWIPLIRSARAMMQAGVPTDSAEAQEVARQWEELTRTFAGDDPVTRQKMRLAFEQEPTLLARTGVDQALLEYIRAAGADAVC